MDKRRGFRRPGLSGKDSIFMGNIDEKRLSGLLERIIRIKEDLESLENEVRDILRTAEPVETAESTVATEPTAVTEPVEVTESTVVTEPAEAIDEPAADEEPIDIDDTPIDIDIPALDIPQVIEDPIAAYDHTVAPADETTTPDASTNPATEPAEVAGPVEESKTAEETAPTAGIEPVETAEPTAAEVADEPAQEGDDLPFDDDLPMDIPVEEPNPEPVAEVKPKAAIIDSTKAETAVMDVMAEKQAWRTDRPGSQVKNVISAISLNDRVLLINVLFKEDPILFQNAISAFNGMSSLNEAISYIQTNFPEWDMNSEPVYRLMMAVRRKLS